MRVPSTPSDVQAQTDSPVDASSSHATLEDAALATAFVQADLNALALQLAEQRIRACLGDSTWVYCAECLYRWFDAPRHTDSCVVGNIFKLAARLGELRDAAARGAAASPQPISGPLCGHCRNGMYCCEERGHTDAHSVRIDGENHFWRNDADAACAHCGPHCAGGAAHNARVEDGVFFRGGRLDRHIEYFAAPIGRGVEALFDPAPVPPGLRLTHEEAALLTATGVSR